MTDPERSTLSGEIKALRAQIVALEEHAREREARHIERHDQVAGRLEAMAHDRREVERRIASLEAVRPQADRVAREAHEATDALHTQQGRREGIEELNIHRWGGTYNNRLVRGSRATWSTHAWAIAEDNWPSQNRFRWRADQAEFARPEYDPMIRCFTAAGWHAMGDELGYDFMHFQAAHW